MNNIVGLTIDQYFEKVKEIKSPYYKNEFLKIKKIIDDFIHSGFNIKSPKSKGFFNFNYSCPYCHHSMIVIEADDDVDARYIKPGYVYVCDCGYKFARVE